MPSINATTASNIVQEHKDSAAVHKVDGTGMHRKYAFRYKLLNPNGRHIAIATPDAQAAIAVGTQEGVTVYINKLSRALDIFPTELTERLLPGVSVTKEYLKGSVGFTGDKGLSSAAAGLETLDPYRHDVLRLSVIDETAFRILLKWYAGEISFGLA